MADGTASWVPAVMVPPGLALFHQMEPPTGSVYGVRSSAGSGAGSGV